MLQDELSVCKHDQLCYESSMYASKAGYIQPSRDELFQACTLSDHTPSSPEICSETFPAPLVLPGDELTLDPPNESDRQSLKSWDQLMRHHRNPGRHTIYVAHPPPAASNVLEVRSWMQPKPGILQADSANNTPPAPSPPATQDIVEYLSAIYHGVTVKVLPVSLLFTTWKDSKRARTPGMAYVGLNLATECIRVRARKSKDNVFDRQLNLNDLIDGALSLLPEDAMALLLVVDHDIYENPEDDFVCGRAYGGSRVAVVSTARYNPRLDEHQSVERHHAWPASHCRAYMDAVCREDMEVSEPPKKRVRKPQVKSRKGVKKNASPEKREAIRSAVIAYNSLPSPLLYSSVEDLEGMWLARVCQTASHEVGHCVGIDHCTYFACVMQATSSLVEDVGQPPYFCPVDDKKIQIVTGSSQTNERLEALNVFCQRFPKIHMFVALAAWIQCRLSENCSLL